MKHLKNKYIYFITLLFVVSSCIKEVTLDFKHEPKLTFNCILNPDSIIKADLTFSRILGTEGEYLSAEDAEIKFFENNIFLGAMKESSNGNYYYNYHPKTGNAYSVKINVKGMPIMKATTTIPKRTKIEFVSVPKNPLEKYPKMIVKIHDKIGANFYWNYTYSISQKNGTIQYSALPAIFSPHFDNFNRQIDASYEYGFHYWKMLRIKDELYDGKKLQWEQNWRTFNAADFFDVYLETDSCYDRYLKTTIQTRMLENEGIPMSEPVQIYSNIENGYGIFGSCIKTIRKH